MTNKILISLVLFFAVIFSAKAQKFHGGIIAGLSASQVAGDTYSGYDKAGIYAGGYVSLDISERSAFQMELAYFQKGSRKNPDSLDYTSYLFRTNYVELTFLYLYKINKFTFEIGPSAGFLVGYTERRDGYPVYSDNLPAAVTLQINAGLRFDINDRWTANFRTNNSLLNIRKHNVTGDVWRFWTYGQFHDVLVLAVLYKLK